jgi:hypothetical protein
MGVVGKNQGKGFFIYKKAKKYLTLSESCKAVYQGGRPIITNQIS